VPGFIGFPQYPFHTRCKNPQPFSSGHIDRAIELRTGAQGLIRFLPRAKQRLASRNRAEIAATNVSKMRRGDLILNPIYKAEIPAR